MTEISLLKAQAVLPFAAVLLLVAGGCGDDFHTETPITTVAGSVEAASFEGGFDWPQWRGPGRDGLSLEKGLAREWPEKGPTELWRRTVGTGFSGVIVSKGSLFTLDQKEGESLVALSAQTGEEQWRLPLSSGFSSGQG